MKRLITYSEQDIANIKTLLNLVPITGIDNWSRMAMVVNLLNAGKPAEIKEDNKEMQKEGEV